MLSELLKERKKLRKAFDQLMLETQRVLVKDKFSEKNILDNLKEYNKSFELLNEEEINEEHLFTLSEIRSFCIKNRLRFIDSQKFKSEFPYESILKIKDINSFQRKDLRHFKVMCSEESLKHPDSKMPCALFVKTVNENYYLIHHWGGTIDSKRKIKYWSLRNFETAFSTLLFIVLFITLIIPNRYLTTDSHVGYFSMYRAACFFHVLIIAIGFFVFRMLATNKKLSADNWNQYRI
jgi:hypothetical protein